MRDAIGSENMIEPPSKNKSHQTTSLGQSALKSSITMHSQLANSKGNLNQRQQPQMSVTTVEVDYGISQPQQHLQSSAKNKKHGSVPSLHLNSAKQPLRKSFQDNTRVIVHDNWLGPDEHN